MSQLLKTAAVSRELGTTYHRLFGLIRYGKLPPPARDSSGDYVWTRREVERARRMLGAGRQEVTS
jgi:hypothetical protein